MDISPALEDYLESILVIQKESSIVRVKDLVDKLDVKPPSVNEALLNLKQKGLIAHEPYGNVELTSRGLALAKRIFKKHNMLKRFFSEVLGVDEKIAEEDACKIEHYLSPETIEKMVVFIEGKGQR